MRRTAVISDCGAYRYRLGRRWSPGPALLFVMLNPSMADAAIDDPTIRKCMGFAKRHGFAAMEAVNLFAFRATDPAALRAAGWPVGDRNAHHLAAAMREVVQGGGNVVLGWGAQARGRPEALRLVSRMTALSIPMYVLRLLADGTPAHPLMLPYSCVLEEMRQLTNATAASVGDPNTRPGWGERGANEGLEFGP